RHRTVAAHSLVCVEEAASGLLRDPLLDRDDLGYRTHRGDLGTVAFAAIHRAHDQDRGVGKSGADAADGANKLRPILLFNVGGEARLISPVVDDDEVGIPVREGGGEGLRVERAGHDDGGGTVETDAVVRESPRVATQNDPEDLDGRL